MHCVIFQNEIVANVKQEEDLPEAEAAKKIVCKVIDGEEKKEEDGIDQEISSQVSDVFIFYFLFFFTLKSALR